MKQPTKIRKLLLKRETVRHLASDELSRAAGARGKITFTDCTTDDTVPSFGTICWTCGR